MPYNKESGSLHQAGKQPKAARTTEAYGSTRAVGSDSGFTAEQASHYHHEITIPDWLDGNQAGDEPAPAHRLDLLLLHRQQGTWEGIERAVASKAWRYQSASDSTALRSALVRGAKVVLVDSSFLPELNRDPEWARARDLNKTALFCVSDRCDVGTRIEAIKAGTRKLYLEPFDPNALIEAIEDYIQPKTQPDFRVLIIADDQAKAEPAAQLLRNGNLETFVLTEPLEVIDAIWRIRPSLILMTDLHATDIDNLILTKLIRDREESVAIPIVFLSGHQDPTWEQQALQAGADDFLPVSAQRQRLLTTVRCRIERNQAISSAGVQRSTEHYAVLPDRQAMLSRLEQTGSEQEDGLWCHGVTVIALDSPQMDSTHRKGNTKDQLISQVAEDLAPILQGQDYLARIEEGHLALLIRRGKKKEVERLTGLTFEIVNYRLNTHNLPVKGFGIGLVLLEDDGRSSEELLQQGELAADAAYRQGLQQYDAYTETPSPRGIEVKEGSAWRKEDFLHILQSGAVSFRERKFFCLQRQIQVETIELLPFFNFANSPVDIYQQAALCGAAADFDRHLFELGIERLSEYALQAKPVRLILRQSAAALEEQDYIESLKDILRRMHIVGSGLVLEFTLSAIASRLRRSVALFEELAALGVGISISHFPCNKSGYKVLSYLRTDVVRPRSSILHSETEDIERITKKIHSKQAEIILPYIDQIERISPKWWKSADYIQAEFPHPEPHQDELREDLLSLYLGAYRGEHRTVCDWM